MATNKLLVSDNFLYQEDNKANLMTFFDTLAERKTKKVTVKAAYAVGEPSGSSLSYGHYDFSDMDSPRFVEDGSVTFTSSLVDAALIKELVDTNLVVEDEDGEMFFMSPSAYFTFTKKAGMSTARLAESNNPARASYLHSIMKGQVYTFCYASEGNLNRVFAVGSEEYCHINASELAKLCDSLDGWKMGDSTLVYANATQDMTEVVLGYQNVPVLSSGEDINEVYNTYGFMPAVILQTSDSGHSAYRAIAGWVRNGHYTVEKITSRVHRYSVNLKKLQKDIEKNIFTEFTRLLPTLNELGNRMVSNFGDPNPQQLVESFINKLIDTAKDKLKKSETWASAKLMKSLKEEILIKMVAEFDLTDPITQQDVVATAMGAVEWFKAPRSFETEFAAFIGTLPYVAEAM